MAEKKVRKKAVRKKVKEKEVTEAEPSKKVVAKENSQLIWFFAIIVVVFLAFIIPYLYLEGKKSFEYSGLEWQIEKFGQITAYHTKFPALDRSNINYNLYLRNDPRENNATTYGNFNLFKRQGYISFSPEVDLCRGDVARVMTDLGGFLRYGVGMDNLTVATTDAETAKSLNRPYIDCSSTNEATAILIKMGNPSATRTEENCYIITVADCNDIVPVEKFMLKTTMDLRGES